MTRPSGPTADPSVPSQYSSRELSKTSVRISGLTPPNTSTRPSGNRVDGLFFANLGAKNAADNFLRSASSCRALSFEVWEAELSFCLRDLFSSLACAAVLSVRRNPFIFFILRCSHALEHNFPLTPASPLHCVEHGCPSFAMRLLRSCSFLSTAAPAAAWPPCSASKFREHVRGHSNSKALHKTASHTSPADGSAWLSVPVPPRRPRRPACTGRELLSCGEGWAKHDAQSTSPTASWITGVRFITPLFTATS